MPLARLCFALLLLPALASCTTVFFQPLDREHWATPVQYGLPYEDVWFETEDEVQLHGWFLPAFGEPEGTVVFLHGNTEDIGSHIAEIAWMPAERLNVFLFDYRGYGLSRGEPALPQVLRDIEAALAHVVRRTDLGRGVIVYGQSMGGALAPYALLHSTHRSKVKALILDGAFASFELIAHDTLGDFLFRRLGASVPLHHLNTYDPLTAIAALSPLPILIIHSETDRVVPVRHASLLYGAARAPKTLWRLPNGAHAQTLRDPANNEVRELWLRYALTVLGETGQLSPGPELKILGISLPARRASSYPGLIDSWK